MDDNGKVIYGLIPLSQWMTTLIINEGKDKNDYLQKNMDKKELQTITNNLTEARGRIIARKII